MGGVYAIKKEYRLVLLCDPFGAFTVAVYIFDL